MASNNEVVGFNKCLAPGCGGKTEVMVTKRNGNHLYARCTECGGLNQDNKTPMQNYFWYRSEWRGEPPKKPGNVTENSTVKPTVEQPEQPSKPGVSEDIDLSGETTETNPKTKPKGRFLKVLGVGILIATVGGAVWKA